MSEADQLLFQKLREHMKDNNTEGIKEVKEALAAKGYNVDQPNIVSEYNVITGQQISIKEDPDEVSDHSEPFEDEGAYADDSED